MEIGKERLSCRNNKMNITCGQLNQNSRVTGRYGFETATLAEELVFVFLIILLLNDVVSCSNIKESKLMLRSLKVRWMKYFTMAG